MALETANYLLLKVLMYLKTGRRQSELDKAVEEIGYNVTRVQADSGKLEDTAVFDVVSQEV